MLAADVLRLVLVERGDLVAGWIVTLLNSSLLGQYTRRQDELVRRRICRRIQTSLVVVSSLFRALCYFLFDVFFFF